MNVTASQFRDDLLTWAETNLREFPWRVPTASVYEVFIAEFFLTQTPAENVAEVYPRFLERFPSLDTLEAVSETTVAAVIEPLGFHNIRAKALTNIAAEHDVLPETVEELKSLERVGPYVANATLCFALDRHLPIVDRNVDRVYRRVLGPDWPESLSDQWDVAGRLVPTDVPRRYNLALLDFAATVCKPDPRCSVCFATPYCHYFVNKCESD